MTKSSIEITDTAYLIKLHKEDFDYPLVRRLMNKLLYGNPSADEIGFSEEDIVGRYSPEYGERFDSLEDK